MGSTITRGAGRVPRVLCFSLGCVGAVSACARGHEASDGASDAAALLDAPAGEPSDAGATAPAPYGCAGATDATRRPAVCDFAHIAFRVTDLAKARAFYGDFLGLAEPFPVSDTVAVYKINDNQFIELYAEVAAPGDTNFQLKNTAFSTSDAEALRRYFASRNIQVPAGVSRNVLGNTSFTITDPDGHVMEWVQYEKGSLTGTTVGQALPDARVGGSVHHLGVTILDPAASQGFFETGLGFSSSTTADKQASRLPAASVRIEYGVAHSAPTRGFAVVRDHLCLRVADTMKAVATLGARDPSIPVEHHVLQGFTVRANVYDPDGTRIEMADSLLLPSGEATGSGDVGELDSGSSDQ